MHNQIMKITMPLWIPSLRVLCAGTIVRVPVGSGTT
jgi:hypothetical protein